MTTRPHVAVVDVTARMGGAQRSILALARATVDAARFTFVLAEPGDLADAVRAAGCDVVIVPWSESVLAVGERSGRPSIWRGPLVLSGMFGAARRLRRALRSIAPDAVITNGVKPHIMTTLALMPRPAVPLIWYLRDSLEGKRLSRALLAACARACSGAIAISRFIAADAETYLPASVPRVVLFNIMEPVAEPGPVRAVRRDDDVRFAMIGALTPLKGQDLFLRAAARIAADVPRARFLIIGSAMYKSEARMNYTDTLRALSVELGLESRVEFFGQRDDVPALLCDVDVLVQPNRGPEGFGRSVAEAMMTGVAVIASNGWGLKELVRHDETGWLIEPGDVPALAEAMRTLGTDAARRARLAESGRNWTLSHLSADRSASEFLTFLAARLA